MRGMEPPKKGWYEEPNKLESGGDKHHALSLHPKEEVS